MVQSELVTVRLTEIRTDGGTQPRAQLDLAIIAEYAEAMANGANFPPVVVFYDGEDYWLADGFHRISAAQQLGLADIDTDVRQGTLQDAQWYSYSVNQAHGLRRSNPDKRHAVEAALSHPYAADKSDREIADHCGVSHMLVNNIRNELKSTVNFLQSDTRTGRDGRTYNTANIGHNGNGHPQTTPPMFTEDEDEEEIELHFDPSAQVAYCKYCYETHGDWTYNGEFWLCERCEHGTHDDYMQVAEEPEPETIDYGGDSEYDSNEWYTPLEFIEAARTVMGYIDLDPASCDLAQQVVDAGNYFTKEQDGLAQEWRGNIWLNPPYGDPLPWIEKLIAEHVAHRLEEAILLINTANSPQWSRLLWHSNYAVCLLDRRVRFWRPDRAEAKGTAQDQMIWYIGDNINRFREVFEPFGAIR